MCDKTPGKQHGRILCVDDDHRQQEMAFMVLSNQGYSVECVNTGTQCLEVLANHPLPDMVLLDLRLPDLNGAAVLKKIRESFQTYQLPVIIVSGHNDADHITNALDNGANDFIIRPLDTNVFLARVNACMKITRGIQENLNVTREQVMFETLGAACHHVAQPMTVLQSSLELYVNEIPPNQDQARNKMKELLHWAQQTSDTIHQLQNIQTYRTVKYFGESKILDIQQEAHEWAEQTDVSKLTFS